jgi:hypothetical protein
MLGFPAFRQAAGIPRPRSWRKAHRGVLRPDREGGQIPVHLQGIDMTQPSEALLRAEFPAAFADPIETHLHALATEEDLPGLAIGICAMRAREAAPALLAVLDRAADGEALDEDAATLLFRGLHILGGMRDQRAFPPLLRLLARSPEEVEYLLGDAVTQTLPKIAAGTFDGDAEALFAAIAGGAADEFARDALLGAATFLTWEGRIGRDRMQAFLERLFDVLLAAEGEIVWIGWVQAVALLGLRPLAPLAHRAFEEGIVPPEAITRRQFDKDLARAEREPDDIRRFTEANLGLIGDVLVALEDTFRGGPPGDWPPLSQGLVSGGGPATNPMRDVGRNDPCPCGSGKKAKKCCLAS